MELMAPAGGPEAAVAALQAGADAIYLGLKKFSARADAQNFSREELSEIVGYAHGLEPRRRVYVTLNTLVLDRELPEMLEALGAIADAGVDAVIAQDLAVAHAARRFFPNLRLHASTQLAVHSRAGVETARQLGFARVVLARELTLEEIREAASVPGIEVETFVQGALCYAYSGLCLFSSHMVGRSGNRGQCAYPCRDLWRIEGEPPCRRDGSAPPRDPRQGFAFSMKDLSLADQVEKLRDAGVYSLKIEGRKKSPLYVAATVGLYRGLIDGRFGEAERKEREADIQAIFSRPWTGLYLRSPRDKDVADPDTVGHRGVAIGRVEAIGRSGDEVLVRFETSRALEKHDGLQIDIPGLGRPFGFGIEVMRVVGQGRKSRSVVRAEAGSKVEVALPDGYPTIPTGAPIYCSSSQDVKRRYRLEPQNLGAWRSRAVLDLEATLERNELVVRGRAARPGLAPAEAEISLAGPFERAKDPSRTPEAFRKAMEKLGDSALALGACRLADSEGLFVPVSRLNELRRQLATRIEEALGASSRARLDAARAELLASGPVPEAAPGVRWSLKVDGPSTLTAFEPRDWSELREVVVDIGREPLEQLEPALERLVGEIGSDRVRLALPVIARRWEEPGLRKKIERLLGRGFRRWEASNLSAWSLLGIDPAAGHSLDLSADWPLYTLNRLAARQLASMGIGAVVLSPEDSLENLRGLLAQLGDRATVAVYQDTPLFISESCPNATLSGGCPGPARCGFERMDLVSSHGSEVLAFGDRCRTITVSRLPFCLARRRRELDEAGARSLRVDFVWRPYAPEEARRIWRALRGEGALPEGHVGNFDRGLA